MLKRLTLATTLIVLATQASAGFDLLCVDSNSYRKTDIHFRIIVEDDGVAKVYRRDEKTRRYSDDPDMQGVAEVTEDKILFSQVVRLIGEGSDGLRFDLDRVFGVLTAFPEGFDEIIEDAGTCEPVVPKI